MSEKFDPDEYLKEMGNKSAIPDYHFDPDAYLADLKKSTPSATPDVAVPHETSAPFEVATSPVNSRISAIASALDPLGKAYDQAGDIVNSFVGHAAKNLLPGGERIAAGFESAVTPKTYEEALNELHAKNELRAQEHPYASAAGDIAGFVASPTNKLVSAGQKILGGAVSRTDKIRKLLEAVAKYAPVAGQGAAYAYGENPTPESAAAGAATSALATKFPVATTGAFLASLPFSGENKLPAAAVGAAALPLASRASQATRSLGKALQLPQEGADRLYGMIGGKVPEELVSVGNAKPTGSKYTQQLKDLINASELGPHKKIFDEVLADIQPFAGKSYPDLGNEERQVFLNSLNRLAKSRQKNAYDISPERLQQSVNEQLQLNPALAQVPVEEFLKFRVLSTPATGLKWASTTIKPIEVDRHAEDVLGYRENVQNLLQQLEQGKLNENLEATEKYGQVPQRKGGFGDLVVDLLEKEKAKSPQVTREAFDKISAQKQALNARKKLNDIARGRRAMQLLGGSGGIGALVAGHGGASVLGALPFGIDESASLGRFLERKGGEMGSSNLKIDNDVARALAMKQLQDWLESNHK